MDKEKLRDGLVFARNYRLTITEIEVLLKFFERDRTTSELKGIDDVNKNTINYILQRLVIKNLIKEKGKEGKHKVFTLNS